MKKITWSPQALRILHERYLVRDLDGRVVETPERMCHRVALEAAKAEENYGGEKKEVKLWAKNYYQLLSSRRFLPNSPTLMNAGTGNGLQYSACFVLPVGDSLIEIFDAIKNAAIIHQSGGGTGFSFSRLRPRGSMVRRSRGVASGPVSFMRIFDAATEQIKQGGKRRGANMGILRVDHPDILEFIHCKEGGGIANFNISVAATREFMEALTRGKAYQLTAPHTGEAVGRLPAPQVFDKICEAAWRTGDPGLIFIDRINDGSANPVPSLGPIEATNPCGEQPLYPYDACNLGSIFLKYFVKGQRQKKIDWDGLAETTRTAVRFLDSIIDRNPFPLPEIEETVKSIRRIGLGVGGWADMLVQLGIPYDSSEALKLAEKVMKFINQRADRASKDLAKERGPFPLFEKSIYKKGAPRRNSTVTTIAPTGSIGIIADASTGIEPYFALAFRHIVKDKELGRELTFVNPFFEERVKGRSWFAGEVKKEVLASGHVRGVKGVPKKIQEVFATAHDIDYRWHIKTQAAFQKFTDNAVSKTINLPHEATVRDIKNAYLLAYKSGCRGITVYRDGCKEAQVLNLGVAEKKATEVAELGARLKPRPLILRGQTFRVPTPFGTAFITVNSDERGTPFEVFVNVGKAGMETAAMAEALGRMISLSLRIPSDLDPRRVVAAIVDQLSGIGGSNHIGFGKQRVRSLADAVAKVLAEYLAAGGVTKKIKSSKRDLCPECGAAALVFEEGCYKCLSCGYSKC